MPVVAPRHREAVAPPDAWVANQKQPLSAGLLQATLLDVFRRTSSLAAALLGMEAIQPTIARPVLEAIGRVGLESRAAVFFAVPAATVEPLPIGRRRISIDLARTPQGRFELAKGMHKALSLSAMQG